MRKRNKGTRNGTADLFRRVCEMTVAASQRECPSRLGLAERWRITPRAVSHLVAHARAVYGVEVRHDDLVNGYVLESPGVLDLDALGRWKR